MLYYITPQVWAWRRGRVRKLIDAPTVWRWCCRSRRIICGAGERAASSAIHCSIRSSRAGSRGQTLALHVINCPRARHARLLPGSRRVKSVICCRRWWRPRRVLTGEHNLRRASRWRRRSTRASSGRHTGPRFDGIRIIQNDTYSIVAASEVALVASGTATLETALLGCPMVIAYKMSPRPMWWRNVGDWSQIISGCLIYWPAAKSSPS